MGMRILVVLWQRIRDEPEWTQMAGFGRDWWRIGDGRRRSGVGWRGLARRGESLETRVLLTGVFADSFDVTLLPPTSVSLDDPFDGVWNGEQFEIIGAEANQAAL